MADRKAKVGKTFYGSSNLPLTSQPIYENKIKPGSSRALSFYKIGYIMDLESENGVLISLHV